MKPLKPTKADRYHFEELIDLVNAAYLDGKPVTAALECIMLRRFKIQAGYFDRVLKAKLRAEAAEAEIARLRSELAAAVQ